MAEGSFELRPVGPYSLAESVRFLEGFAPAAYEGHAEGHLHLAFVADGGEDVAGVCVREKDGVIVGDVSGDAGVEVVKGQVGRILSLDVDGSGFPEVGRRDPVVGALQARYPGLRPVCFHSPYEAAAWALIGQRIRIVQAAGIKNRMAEELGPLSPRRPGPKARHGGVEARLVHEHEPPGVEAARQPPPQAPSSSSRSEASGYFLSGQPPGSPWIVLPTVEAETLVPPWPPRRPRGAPPA